MSVAVYRKGKSMKFQFRKVKGSRTYKKWSEWELGDFVVGKFIEQGQDQYKKNNYIVEVIETSFEDVKVGSNLCLNANGSLDYRMEDLDIGTIVRVEYEGEDVLEKGPYKGKKFHKVSVEVAESSLDTTTEEEVEDEYGL